MSRTISKDGLASQANGDSGSDHIGVSPTTGLNSGVGGMLKAFLSDIATQLATKISSTRTVSTTAPLAGGGDLSANRTLSLNDTAVTPGSYTYSSITVDQKGRLTAASSGSPSAVPDASATVKGAAKLSVAPVSSTNPIAVGDNDTRLTNYGEMAFYFSGALTVKTGVGRYPAFVSGTIIGVRATINTAPTGASVIVDVNKNGTTMYTTQANRPTIAVSTNSVNATLPAITTFAAGDYITVDVDQIGSTVAGSDLVVVVRYSY